MEFYPMEKTLYREIEQVLDRIVNEWVCLLVTDQWHTAGDLQTSDQQDASDWRNICVFPQQSGELLPFTW